MKLRFVLSQTTSNFDFLTIYDGSTQIAKLSGYLGSFNISTTIGNYLFLKFQTGGDSKDGFLANIHYGNHNFI